MNRKQIAEIGNRKISVKTLVLATIILAVVIWQQPIVLSAVSPNIQLDDFPTQATYTLKTDGTNYWAVKYDGDIISDSTNFKTVWDAVGALVTSGATVHIQRGTYTLTVGNAPIRLKSNVIYKGEGINVTIITIANGVNAPVIVNQNVDVAGVWDSNFVLRDITINGNGANQATTTWRRTYNVVCLYLERARHYLLERCEFYNGRNFCLRMGFGDILDASPSHCEYGTIRDCFIHKTTETYGQCDGYGVHMRFYNCESYNAGTDRYQAGTGFCQWGIDNMFIGCKAYNNMINAGFYLDNQADEKGICYDQWIIDCESYDNYYGICVSYNQEAHIIDTSIHNIERQGIWLKYASTNAIISGCTIRDCGDSGSGNRFGIEIDDSCGNATITNCWIGDREGSGTQQRVGIFADGVSKMTIRECTFFNNSENQIYVTNSISNWTIENNRFSHYSGSYYGIYVNTNFADGVIRGNTFVDNGLRMAGTSTRTIIEDNRFYGTTGVYLSSTTGLTIEDNLFHSTNKITYGAGSTDTLVRWNTGYRTESSGSQTNTTATTFVFNHNLVATPIHVFASFNAIEITAWTWTASSTQITITVTGTLPASMTAYWEARTWNYP